MFFEFCVGSSSAGGEAMVPRRRPVNTGADRPYTCGICLEEMQDGDVVSLAPCGHTFKKGCWESLVHHHDIRHSDNWRYSDNNPKPLPKCPRTFTNIFTVQYQKPFKF